MKRPVYLIHLNREYPKLALIDRHPPEHEILMISRLKLPALSVTVNTIEKLGEVITLPPTFQSLAIMTPFGSPVLYQGVMLPDLQSEVRFYQELIIQLATEGYLDPNDVASKYDKITKLVALATGNKNLGEHTVAAMRAVELSKKLIRRAD